LLFLRCWFSLEATGSARKPASSSKSLVDSAFQFRAKTFYNIWFTLNHLEKLI
jgi:hypothetical protein